MPTPVPRDGIFNNLHHTEGMCISTKFEPFLVRCPHSRAGRFLRHHFDRQEKLFWVFHPFLRLFRQVLHDWTHPSFTFLWPSWLHLIEDQILHIFHGSAGVVILLGRQQLLGFAQGPKFVTRHDVWINSFCQLGDSGSLVAWHWVGKRDTHWLLPASAIVVVVDHDQGPHPGQVIVRHSRDLVVNQPRGNRKQISTTIIWWRRARSWPCGIPKTVLSHKRSQSTREWRHQVTHLQTQVFIAGIILEHFPNFSNPCSQISTNFKVLVAVPSGVTSSNPGPASGSNGNWLMVASTRSSRGRSSIFTLAGLALARLLRSNSGSSCLAPSCLCFSPSHSCRLFLFLLFLLGSTSGRLTLSSLCPGSALLLPSDFRLCPLATPPRGEAIPDAGPETKFGPTSEAPRLCTSAPTHPLLPDGDQSQRDLRPSLLSSAPERHHGEKVAGGCCGSLVLPGWIQGPLLSG